MDDTTSGGGTYVFLKHNEPKELTKEINRVNKRNARDYRH